LCEHKGRARDRCEHGWWGSFRGKRVSLAKWTNRETGSKSEADIALDELRAATRDGTFDERGLDPPPDNSPMTFGKFADVYKQRHVLAKGLALSSTIDYRLKPLIQRFDERAIADIKTADIDDFVADLKQPRVVNGLDGRRLTPASINRTLGLLRHMLNWAVGREYLDKTPFRRGTEVLIRMELEDNKRRRRLKDEEEAALLAVASPHLRSMIIAALDTGMRRGEMLALLFGDIDWKRRVITLRGATTKSRRTRVVPIGTARLLAVLEWLRLDSDGERKRNDVPVFSNEAGEPLKTFKKAWVVALLKAHGVDPRWRKGSYKDLSVECQQRLREINLHWHDLRHEYASRLVERGVPLAQVRDLLGHASILTTERYDNQTLEALQAAVERLEGGKTFDPKLKATDDLSAVAVSRASAKAEVSRIFQDPTKQRFAEREDPVKESAARH
ncbi:MAG: site-specific integrase, partial [Acidobacteriota bacterium]